MENGQNGYKVKYKSGHFLLRRALMIYQKGILMYLRHSLRGCGDRFPGVFLTIIGFRAQGEGKQIEFLQDPPGF